MSERYRLPARSPGWVVTADVVVVGSGVAGLTAALRARAHGLRVLLVTKDRMDEGSTRWAQGGVAAALGVGDSPLQHLADTLVAGAGLCDGDAVRAMVTEGPDAVRRLIRTGAEFDRGPDGEILLAREGGHHRRRIAHAGGDATGAEISRALTTAVEAAGTVAGTPGEGPSAGPDGAAGPPIRVIEHALALDLLTDLRGCAAGLTLHVMGEGEHDGVGAVRARAVVLATGGIGQVFSSTTNPSVATGDGLALALRAGAEAADLEFVQFHPTVLYLGPEARGRQPLVSEAVRGEGAHLVDADGVRFMVGQHELAELAPRDVVAKAIIRRMHERNARHMYLDGRHFGAEMWERRFPTILAACREHGIDPVTEPVPIAPAAHHASGGIRTDLRGRTSVPGLYACGEVACTGVHGANRLASNSLLEGLVFAERIADELAARAAAGELPAIEPGEPARHAVRRQPLLPAGSRERVQEAMSRGAGVLRSARSLAATAAELDALAAGPADADVPGAGVGADPADPADRKPADPAKEAWEDANLHLVARALTAAAALREETRGGYWREDHPERDDNGSRHRLVITLAGPHGTPAVRPGPPLPPEPAAPAAGAAAPDPDPAAPDTTPTRK